MGFHDDAPACVTMNYGVFRTRSMNLGDEIQTIAAMRFLPRVDSWIDRERLPSYAGQPDVFLIANGWLMHRPRRFPPPPNIRPFYVSIHLGDATILSEEAVAHFKRWEPVGCRDEHTLALLRSRGIAAFFSGCLTWTLPRPDVPRGDDVLLVDVPARLRRIIPDTIRGRARDVTHANLAGLTIDYHPSSPTIMPWSLKSLLEEVRRTGPRAILRRMPGGRVAMPDAVAEDRLRLAGGLLDRYARARLVVTTRLHCYFPCLAFRTPAIFLRPDSAFGPERFTFDEPFMRPVDVAERETIDWQPSPPDISAQRAFLERLCARAVSIQDNPLRHESIDDYYRASGWTGSGVSRRP